MTGEAREGGEREEGERERERERERGGGREGEFHGIPTSSQYSKFLPFGPCLSRVHIRVMHCNVFPRPCSTVHV